jgi:hypothetical protein
MLVGSEHGGTAPPAAALAGKPRHQLGKAQIAPREHSEAARIAALHMAAAAAEKPEVTLGAHGVAQVSDRTAMRQDHKNEIRTSNLQRSRVRFAR